MPAPETLWRRCWLRPHVGGHPSWLGPRMDHLSLGPRRADGRPRRLPRAGSHRPSSRELPTRRMPQDVTGTERIRGSDTGFEPLNQSVQGAPDFSVPGEGCTERIAEQIRQTRAAARGRRRPSAVAHRHRATGTQSVYRLPTRPICRPQHPTMAPPAGSDAAGGGTYANATNMPTCRLHANATKVFSLPSSPLPTPTYLLN